VCSSRVSTIAIRRVKRLLLRKPGEEISQRHCGYTGSDIREPTGKHELVSVNHAAARVNDVRHVPIAFTLVWLEEWLVEMADDMEGIFGIEQNRSQGVAAKRPHPMGDHQPSGLGLEGRTAVAELHEFPRAFGLLDPLGLDPEPHIIGHHEVVVLVVLSRQGSVAPVDLSGEEREALVLGATPVDRSDPERDEVRCFGEMSLINRTRSKGSCRWAYLDLNQGPQPYQG